MTTRGNAEETKGEHWNIMYVCVCLSHEREKEESYNNNLVCARESVVSCKGAGEGDNGTGGGHNSVWEN